MILVTAIQPLLWVGTSEARRPRAPPAVRSELRLTLSSSGVTHVVMLSALSVVVRFDQVASENLVTDDLGRATAQLGTGNRCNRLYLHLFF